MEQPNVQLSRFRQVLNASLLVLGLGLFLFVGNRAVRQANDWSVVNGAERRQQPIKNAGIPSPVVSASLSVPPTLEQITTQPALVPVVQPPVPQPAHAKVVQKDQRTIVRVSQSKAKRSTHAIAAKVKFKTD